MNNHAAENTRVVSYVWITAMSGELAQSGLWEMLLEIRQFETLTDPATARAGAIIPYQFSDVTAVWIGGGAGSKKEVGTANRSNVGGGGGILGYWTGLENAVKVDAGNAIVACGDKDRHVILACTFIADFICIQISLSVCAVLQQGQFGFAKAFRHDLAEMSIDGEVLRRQHVSIL